MRDSAEMAVAALIPALNEEEALPPVLQALGRAGIRRVVVVDNGSTDRTAAVAREAGARVVPEPRRGYGAACLTGLSHLASGASPPDVVVFLDGDGSDDPADLPRLVGPIVRDEADFVVGVRSGGEDGGAVPLHARAGNALVRAGARLLHGARFSDLGPFRAIRFDALKALAMDDRNWGWTLQMQVRAHHAGLRIQEVPVGHGPRKAGTSKVSGSVVGSLKAGAKMLLTLVTEVPVGRRLRRRQWGAKGANGDPPTPPESV